MALGNPHHLEDVALGNPHHLRHQGSWKTLLTTHGTVGLGLPHQLCFLDLGNPHQLCFMALGEKLGHTEGKAKTRERNVEHMRTQAMC